MASPSIDGSPVGALEAPGQRDSYKLHALSPKARGNHDPGATSKRKPLGMKTLVKGTRLCKFYLAGACDRGIHCSFAHGQTELRQVPNLEKTQMCSRFKVSGKCRQGAECKFAHGVHELRRKPNPLDAPKLHEEQDVGPPFASRMPALPTLEAYLRAGMLSDSTSAKEAAGDDCDDASGCVAGMRFENSHSQQQHRQQLLPSHARYGQLMEQLQRQWVLYLQLIVQAAQLPEQPRPCGCQTTAPGSDTLTKDTLADLSFKQVPSFGKLPTSEENANSEEDRDQQWQSHQHTRYPVPRGWVVTVRNTFIHLGFHEGALARSKSVPAAIRYGHAI